jgi:hypothetical protein
MQMQLLSNSLFNASVFMHLPFLLEMGKNTVESRYIVFQGSGENKQ